MKILSILQAGIQVATNETQVAGIDSENMLSIVMKGGWILVPIAFLSLVAIYLIIAKTIQINAAKNKNQSLTDKVCDLLIEGKVDSAIGICQTNPKPAAIVLAAGIKTLGHPVKDIQDAMEGEARQQIDKLNSGMQYLGVISSIAPMLGFLGTIFGVIKIFYSISLTDNISIGIISEGLYEKMIASAAGLLVGIIAYSGYHLINASIDKVASDIEKQGNKLVAALREN
ncbi:MAG: MotA/TolQ/ExbB proton channel family protein [Prevotellaceae bacterium]|jgi:biopolymer transport protein ExbB|nr:MotA/TolQ/ExbB proton channel family protein [Prevotellaceae bacterium]